MSDLASDLPIALGLAIREARVAAGLSLSGLAKVIDSSASYVSDCERGRCIPGLLWLVECATALNLTTVDLLGNRFPFGSQPRPAELSAPPDGRSVGRMKRDSIAIEQT